LVDCLRHRQILNLHRARVKRGFLKKPIRAAAAKEAGQGMSTEVNGCAPGSKGRWVRKNIFRLWLWMDLLNLRLAAMKTGFIFVANGNFQNRPQDKWDRGQAPRISRATGRGAIKSRRRQLVRALLRCLPAIAHATTIEQATIFGQP